MECFHCILHVYSTRPMLSSTCWSWMMLAWVIVIWRKTTLFIVHAYEAIMGQRDICYWRGVSNQSRRKMMTINSPSVCCGSLEKKLITKARNMLRLYGEGIPSDCDEPGFNNALGIQRPMGKGRHCVWGSYSKQNGRHDLLCECYRVQRTSLCDP